MSRCTSRQPHFLWHLVQHCSWYLSPNSEMSCLWKTMFLHPFRLSFLISTMDRAASTLQHSLGQMTEAVDAKCIWQGLEHRGSTVRVHACPSLPCAVRGPRPQAGLGVASSTGRALATRCSSSSPLPVASMTVRFYPQLFRDASTKRI